MFRNDEEFDSVMAKVTVAVIVIGCIVAGLLGWI